MKALRGLFLGLLSGTIFGVLFAPRKGKELRDKLKQAHDKGEGGFSLIKDDFVKMGKDFLDTMQTFTESSAIQEALSKGKNKFYEVTGMTQEDLDTFVQKAKNQTEKLSEMARKLKNNITPEDLSKNIKKVEKKAKKIAKDIKKKING